MKYQKTWLCICLFFLSLSAYGQSILLCINQQDGIQEKEQKVTVHLEDLLVESFFDNGCIVTTYPISLKEKDSITELLDEGKFGSMDFLVHLTVSINPVTEKITVLDWNCFSIANEKMLEQKHLEVKTYEKNNEKKKLKIISENLVNQIVKTIS